MQIYIITELQKNTKVSSMYTNGQWTWPHVSDFQMLLREGLKKKYGNFHKGVKPVLHFFFVSSIHPEMHLKKNLLEGGTPKISKKLQ